MSSKEMAVRNYEVAELKPVAALSSGDLTVREFRMFSQWLNRRPLTTDLVAKLRAVGGL